jgi:hypothetical protein
MGLTFHQVIKNGDRNIIDGVAEWRNDSTATKSFPLLAFTRVGACKGKRNLLRKLEPPGFIRGVVQINFLN